MNSTQRAMKIMLRGLGAAHTAIIAKAEENDINSAGTTTIIGGMTLQLAGSDNKNRWFFFGVSVGDCRAFHWNSRTGVVNEVVGTESVKAKPVTMRDARDPGGRIGPWTEEGGPDIRNIELFGLECQDHDIIILVSDGIHDNLDPKFVGKTPEDLGLKSTGKSWDTVEDSAQAIKASQQWSLELINKIIGGPESLQTKTTALSIVEKLTNHSLSLTSKSREFMVNNPSKRLPDDSIEYPGKMDHATCLAFVVSRITRSSLTLSRTLSRGRSNSID